MLKEFIDNTLIPLLENRFVHCIIVFIGAILLARVSNHLIKRTLGRRNLTARGGTLASLTASAVKYAIYLVMILEIAQSLFNIQTASLIAASGAIGVAIGLGAQDIVKDIISGFFIIFEDQYEVGDMVTVDGFTGTVTDLGVRTTRIRSFAGDIKMIKNGLIETVVNHSRSRRAVVLELEVGHDADIDAALAVMSREAQRALDELEALTELPEVLGVTKLGDTGITLRLVVKCEPGQQWALEREMLRRLRRAFDRAGLPKPYQRINVVSTQKSE